MFVASLLSPDIANPVATQCQDRENTQNLNSPPLRQPSTSTKDATASTRRQNPYYPYETIGPKTHTHYTRPTTTYWQEIIPTCSVTSLPYSTTPPYQYSFPATLTPETSLLLPIRPLGNTMDDIAVCSLALPHASMTVVKELARILANKIRKFDPEVVMGLPTGGLVLAPFVAEELGFGMLLISVSGTSPLPHWFIMTVCKLVRILSLAHISEFLGIQKREMGAHFNRSQASYKRRRGH